MTVTNYLMAFFIMVFTVQHSFAEDIKYYDDLDLHKEENFKEGIKKIDSYLLQESGSPDGSESFYIKAFLRKDKIFLEGRLVYNERKTMSQEEWFSSNRFISEYEEVERLFHMSLNEALKGNGELSYRNLARIISNPFLSASIKEKAHKYSLQILDESDLGSGEHPLTKDQYIGRIYKTMIRHHCNDGNCNEIYRLASELSQYSEDNKKLADRLVSEYEKELEEEKVNRENERIKQEEKRRLQEEAEQEAKQEQARLDAERKAEEARLAEAARIKSEQEAEQEAEAQRIQVRDERIKLAVITALIIVIAGVVGLFIRRRRSNN